MGSKNIRVGSKNRVAARAERPWIGVRHGDWLAAHIHGKPLARNGTLPGRRAARSDKSLKHCLPSHPFFVHFPPPSPPFISRPPGNSPLLANSVVCSPFHRSKPIPRRQLLALNLNPHPVPTEDEQGAARTLLRVGSVATKYRKEKLNNQHRLVFCRLFVFLSGRHRKEEQSELYYPHLPADKRVMLRYFAILAATSVAAVLGQSGTPASATASAAAATHTIKVGFPVGQHAFSPEITRAEVGDTLGTWHAAGRVRWGMLLTPSSVRIPAQKPLRRVDGPAFPLHSVRSGRAPGQRAVVVRLLAR